jgi:hypothetical protein
MQYPLACGHVYRRADWPIFAKQLKSGSHSRCIKCGYPLTLEEERKLDPKSSRIDISNYTNKELTHEHNAIWLDGYSDNEDTRDLSEASENDLIDEDATEDDGDLSYRFSEDDMTSEDDDSENDSDVDFENTEEEELSEDDDDDDDDEEDEDDEDEDSEDDDQSLKYRIEQQIASNRMGGQSVAY